MTRLRLIAQCCAVLPFLLLALLFSAAAPRAASAQNLPPNCSPVGSVLCTSMYPTTWRYSNRSTCRGFPARSSEAEAAQDIVTDYTRPDQCNLTVKPKGG